ncbi:hypothetical protein B0A49_01566, partial [Cryomyces minteri]
MDDSGSDDMLFEESLLQDSSQESLTDAALYSRNISSGSALPLKTYTRRDLSECGAVSAGLAESSPYGGGNPIQAPQASAPPALSLPAGAVGDREFVLCKIESIFEKIADVLLNGGDRLIIPLKIRSAISGRGFDGESRIVTSESSIRTRDITFPGSTAQEAWKFTVLVRILELVHEALTAEIVITKRDIYYRDPALFVKQSVVDHYVDDLACTFGVSRALLNVTATAKGLIAGSFTIRRKDGVEAQGSSDREGLLVPNMKDIQSISMEKVHWILVIEKEAKGYPDIATRALLRFLAFPSPRNGFSKPPVHALVDFDPDGLGILSTYKYGSFALAHENAALAVSSIRWLGVRSTHIMTEESVHQSQGLLRLSQRDRRKASKMLEQEVFAADGPECEWRRELQIMLMLNVKAEIQLMDARRSG